MYRQIACGQPSRWPWYAEATLEFVFASFVTVRDCTDPVRCCESGIDVLAFGESCAPHKIAFGVASVDSGHQSGVVVCS